MSINKVILVGNLGTDPELHTTEKLKPFCNFSVATNHLFKDSENQNHSRTEWHNVVCFGATAQSCSQFLKKGRQVYVEGRIQSQKWKDKEGHDRFSNRVIANTVHFLGSRPVKEAAEAETPLSISEGERFDDIADDDDDIPF